MLLIQLKLKKNTKIIDQWLDSNTYQALQMDEEYRMYWILKYLFIVLK